jgi:hypothetical protein
LAVFGSANQARLDGIGYEQHANSVFGLEIAGLPNAVGQPIK